MERKNHFARYSRARARARATRGLFYHPPDVGPSFIRKLYGEMDVTLFRDYRQGTDWLAVGKFAICFSCDVDVSKQQGLPVDTFGPGVFKEGGGLVQQFGTLTLVNRAPHPNAAKVFINWLLSRKGQIALQKIMLKHAKTPPILCASIFRKTMCRVSIAALTASSTSTPASPSGRR